jgi:MFS transporter, CP family, cyanate transporter
MGKATFVAGTWLAGFTMWGTLLAVVPVLGQLGSDLHLARSQLGLVFSIPILTLAFVAPLGGILADRFGPRRIGAAGLAFVGLGGLLRGYSVDLASVLAFSILFGAGWGLSLPNLPKIVGGWFEKKSSGAVTGIYSTGIYVGAGVATAVTLSSFWRINLIGWGILSLFVSILWWAMIRDPPLPSKADSSNFAGVLRNRSLLVLTAIFFLGANVTFYTLTGWLPQILASTSWIGSPTFVASLLSFFAAPSTILVPLASDRIRLRRPFLLIPCISGSAASYALLSGPTGLQAASVAALGVSISAIFVICLTLSAELVDPRMVGSASGLMLLAYSGGVLGPWLSGFTQDLTGGFAPTMVMLVASFLVSAALALALPETGRTAPDAR